VRLLVAKAYHFLRWADGPLNDTAELEWCVRAGPLMAEVDGLAGGRVGSR
jgi:hypothetical protein